MAAANSAWHARKVATKRLFGLYKGWFGERLFGLFTVARSVLDFMNLSDCDSIKTVVELFAISRRSRAATQCTKSVISTVPTH